MFEKQARACWLGLKCRRGAAMVEYAILIATIAGIASVALMPLGTNMRTMFTNLAASI